MEKNDSKPKKKKWWLLASISFFMPFLVVSVLWTLIDYCDISDGIEKERDIGITHKVSESQILLNSFKGSLLFALPAGLIGLVAASAVFRKSNSDLDSTK